MRAAFSDADIMGDDQDGGAEPLVQVADQGEDLAAGMRIQVSGGLIGQQDGGIKCQGAGDGHTLALAAGEFVGQVVEAAAELHEFQQRARALIDLLAASPFEVQGQGYVRRKRARAGG
jgi:hypothetical protein